MNKSIFETLNDISNSAKDKCSKNEDYKEGFIFCFNEVFDKVIKPLLPFKQKYNEEVFKNKLLNRYLEQARDLLEQERKISDWQPIETAPKDGTEIAIITNFQNPIKFQTFVEFKDLPEKLKEAVLICYDAEYCDRLYDAAGDCLFDVTDQNQVERALESDIFEQEKLKTLLQFMQEFNIKFIQD